MLTGKTILLGVTGGIAVYKAAELLRLFVKAGADVHVVMTRAACEFVTPLTFQTLSGNPVHTELFDLFQEREIGHISLADRADLCVLAPATANTIAKAAAGLADDLLSTTLLATRAPILAAPAMNVNMWENPLYRQNQAKLEAAGWRFVEPATGFLACGWEGKGKFPPPEVVFEECLPLLREPDLAGETVLVTAGPTREELDPVRYLSNYSSGKMGYALARAARVRGARVVLVSGPTALAAPVGVEFCRVTSAQQMHRAVMERYREATVILKAAAVADYRPAARAGQKVKKGREERLELALVRNPDILAELGRVKGERILVGFAAETADLEANAGKKLREKNLDLIVANDVTREGAGFDVDTNIVRIWSREGEDASLPQMTKDQVAHEILDRIVARRAAGTAATRG